MRQLWIILIALLLIGCSPTSKFNNPVAPNTEGHPISAPPVVYLDFNNTINNLKTPSDVKLWIDRYGIYNGYAVGWGDTSPGSTVDNAKNLAYNFWLTTKNKGVGGVCGNFAGFYIYACRSHGYKTGGVVYYWQSNGTVTGHIQAWVVENDGRVSVTNNDGYSYKVYANLKELKASFDSQWNSSTSYCFYVNDHCNQMTQQELDETFK